MPMHDLRMSARFVARNRHFSAEIQTLPGRPRAPHRLRGSGVVSVCVSQHHRAGPHTRRGDTFRNEPRGGAGRPGVPALLPTSSCTMWLEIVAGGSAGERLLRDLFPGGPLHPAAGYLCRPYPSRLPEPPSFGCSPSSSSPSATPNLLGPGPAILWSTPPFRVNARAGACTR
jgi:hypothetical protein